jgi:hypothetical protein
LRATHSQRGQLAGALWIRFLWTDMVAQQNDEPISYTRRGVTPLKRDIKSGRRMVPPKVKEKLLRRRLGSAPPAPQTHLLHAP